MACYDETKHLSYCLSVRNSLRAEVQKLTFIAPMPEQIGTPTMRSPGVSRGICQHSTPWTLRECIVVAAICSGMGATNFISRAPTNSSL